MHLGYFSVQKTSVQRIIRHLGNITAVGTTSVRTVESLSWLGCKILDGVDLNNLTISQFHPYESRNRNVSAEDSLNAIIQYLDKNNLVAINASTEIMITSEYELRIVDNLITNFHQPQSTLLLLIAAFVGNNWREIYNYALSNGYRFLSYGDSSLLSKRV